MWQASPPFFPPLQTSECCVDSSHRAGSCWKKQWLPNGTKGYIFVQILLYFISSEMCQITSLLICTFSPHSERSLKTFWKLLWTPGGWQFQVYSQFQVPVTSTSQRSFAPHIPRWLFPFRSHQTRSRPILYFPQNKSHQTLISEGDFIEKTRQTSTSVFAPYSIILQQPDCWKLRLDSFSSQAWASARSLGPLSLQGGHG